MRAMVGNLWSVFKLRISFAIMLCALAGIAVTPGPKPEVWQLVVLALAVLASAGSAGAFNHYVERDLDARMARTRGRPFVTGVFQAGPLWLTMILGLLVVAVLAAALATNWTAALYVFLGAFVYGVVYTVWLKNRTWMNIVLGGLAGSFAVLAGAAAVAPGLAPVPIILALVLFLWTPPHFWSLATVLYEDYRRAGVPMLPVVVGKARAAWVILAHTVALVLLSVLPVFYGMGPLYLAGAVVGGVYFIWKCVILVRKPSVMTAPRGLPCLALTALLAALGGHRRSLARSLRAPRMLAGRAIAVALLLLWGLSGSAGAQTPEDLETALMDPQAALARSRSAIGRELMDVGFTDQEGRRGRLAEYRGRPLVISSVFTACTVSCPLILQRLAEAVEVARETLGSDGFSVVTFGLDPHVDTPERLVAYADSQGVGLTGWDFVALEPEAIEALTDQLGFTYFPSPRGFDHIAQVSVIDSEGRVFSHVYGQDFASSALVEPLKAAVFDDLAALASIDQVIERIRLFCTFYDAKRDRYYFDYSFFIALIVGLGALTTMGVILARAWLKADPPPGAS